MGNARLEKFRAPLERLAASEDAVVAGHARWALENQVPLDALEKSILFVKGKLK
jgi:hypothetical protein